MKEFIEEQNQQLEKLFCGWKEKIEENGEGVFCEDGIINFKIWKEQPLKLLFILKDVNSNDGNLVDLKKFLSDGGNWRTWNNIARWASILLDGKPWDGKRREDMLERIAAMNVKKTCGTSKANDSVIKDHINRYAAEIKEEIEIIEPDLIISCMSGIWYTLSECIGIEYLAEKTLKSEFNRNYEYGFLTLKNQKKVPIVQYRHPLFCNSGKSQIDMRVIRELHAVIRLTAR